MHKITLSKRNRRKDTDSTHPPVRVESPAAGLKQHPTKLLRHKQMKAAMAVGVQPGAATGNFKPAPFNTNLPVVDDKAQRSSLRKDPVSEHGNV